MCGNSGTRTDFSLRDEKHGVVPMPSFLRSLMRSPRSEGLYTVDSFCRNRVGMRELLTKLRKDDLGACHLSFGERTQRRVLIVSLAMGGSR